MNQFTNNCRSNVTYIMVILLSIILGLCSISGASVKTVELYRGQAVKGLKAELNVKGSIFRERESIPLELKLHNVSDTPFSLYGQVGPTPTPAGVTFYLRHGEDQTITAFTSGSKTVFGHIRLKPGHSKPYQIQMKIRKPNESGGIYSRDINNPDLAIAHILEPGDWELWLKVNYQKGAGKVKGISDAWEGVILSNPVSFKVINQKAEDQSVNITEPIVLESKRPLTREELVALIEEDLSTIKGRKDLDESAKACETLFWNMQRFQARDLENQANFELYLNKLYSLFKKEENSTIKFVLGFVLLRLGEQRPAAYIALAVSRGTCGHMSPESILNTKSFWVVGHSPLPDPCEGVRYATIMILQKVSDNQVVQQALRQVIQNDNSVWVRSAAIGSLWRLGYRGAYVKEISHQSDAQRQLQLIDDLITTSKVVRGEKIDIPLQFYPLQVHEIAKVRELKKTTTDERVRSKLETLLLDEADKTIRFYELGETGGGQLNKPLIVTNFQVLLPEFNALHIERLKILANQENEHSIQRILLGIIEDYHTSKSSQATKSNGF